MNTCRYLQQCGGCTIGKGSYQRQAKEKELFVRELFKGHRTDALIAAENPFHYRHKIYGTFFKDKNECTHLGLYQKNTHMLFDSTECLIQHETANRILKSIAEIADELRLPVYDEDQKKGILRHVYLRISHWTKDVLAVIVTGSDRFPSSAKFVKKLCAANPEIKTVIWNQNKRKTSMVLGEKNQVLFGKGYIIDRIGDVTFKISPQSFYQVNPVMTEKLYAKAIELANLKKTDLVLDVCCGIGTISLLASKQCAFVIGVEINPTAVRDAVNNACHNKIENVSFTAEDAEDFMRKMREKPDVVFLDPPRSGLSRRTIQEICRLKPGRIVYISCNPETQKRDTAQFEKAEYQIKKIVPVDQFSFTEHVETVVLMSRVVR